MEISIFIAKLLGSYMLIVAILLAARQDICLKAIRSYLSNPGLVLTAGTISLLGGLSVLIGHPIWTFDWRGVVTILGLLMIVKGIVNIATPELAISIANSIIQNKNYFIIYLLVYALIGLYLTANAFS